MYGTGISLFLYSLACLIVELNVDISKGGTSTTGLTTSATLSEMRIEKTNLVSLSPSSGIVSRTLNSMEY